MRWCAIKKLLHTMQHQMGIHLVKFTVWGIIWYISSFTHFICMLCTLYVECWCYPDSNLFYLLCILQRELLRTYTHICLKILQYYQHQLSAHSSSSQTYNNNTTTRALDRHSASPSSPQLMSCTHTQCDRWTLSDTIPIPPAKWRQR